MDARSQKELRRITAGTPRDLAKNVTMTEVDTSEEDMVRELLASGKLSHAKRRELEYLLKKGAFRRSEVVVNERVVKELERYNAAMIERGRRNGTLSDPMKDPFFRKRMQRLREMRRHAR